MSGPRMPIEELIQIVLDGEATPAEQQELETRMAADPEARERYAELKAAHALLAGAHSEDAPEGLHDAVMAEIRRTAVPVPVRAPARGGFAGWLLNRRGLVFAVTLLAALGVTWWAIRSGPGTSSGTGMTGTMGASEPLGSVRLGEGAAAATVNWERTQRGFRVVVLTGATGARFACEPLEPGVNLQSRAIADGVALAPHSTFVLQGYSAQPTAHLRVTLALDDGHVLTHEIELAGLPTPVID